MARGVNKVILVGNLGADPETRSMPSGMTVTNIRIATSESWKDKASGAQQERTEWHNIALFGRLGEIAAEYLRKGSQVFVEGKLRTRKWQDKQGNDRFTTEIIADNMQMLGGRSGGARRHGGRHGAQRGRERRAAGGLRSVSGAGRREGRLRRRHPVLGATLDHQSSESCWPGNSASMKPNWADRESAAGTRYHRGGRPRAAPPGRENPDGAIDGVPQASTPV